MIKSNGPEIKVSVRLTMFNLLLRLYKKCSCNIVQYMLLYLTLSGHHLYIYQITSTTNLEDLFLLLPGNLGLQQLSADPLGSLLQLVLELDGLQGLSLSSLQGLHIGCMQHHLPLILILCFSCQLCLGNGKEEFILSLHVKQVSVNCSCHFCCYAILDTIDAHINLSLY